MDYSGILTELALGPSRFAALLAGLDTMTAAWRPQPASWSALEVVCHLRDEEREDFPARLGHVLARRPGPWPPIDPEGWAVARHYQQDDLPGALADFTAARQAALRWLAGLAAPDWSLSYEAPWGLLSAADLLGSWLAHDNLHLRQLIRWQRARLELLTAGCGLQYAGAWE
ncbi:MAG: DinB family protein [Fimbriimonadaceae bacterium]|nr:DinB family protein [Fimbriimonadaceae bacterium]